MTDFPTFDKNTFLTDSYVKRIDKPWGYELHWTPDNLPYMGKLIHVNAGARLSLQVHDKKQESWYIINGKGKVIWENSKGEIIETELINGKGYSCKLGQKHRLAGITDCDIVEVSTPEMGTTYRLEDDYKRPDETEEQRKKRKRRKMTKIIDLDEAVLNALNFFISNPPPKFNTNDFELPFVVGSGNAYNTGQILFSEKAAIYADESNFKKIVDSYEKAIMNKMITQAVIISASGGKDSVWELELAKEKGLQTTLLTTKSNSDAAKIADKVHVFKSLDEPYTYNTSTYMGMVLASTQENVVKIKDFIEKINFPENFNDYRSYAFVLPDKYLSICPMLDIKKSELFGPLLSLRAFSQGHARHAKFVIRTPEELVISINNKNEFFGQSEHRWNLNLPDEFDFAAIIAITYFIVGNIQKAKPPFFKENVQNYVNDYGPKAYGKETPFELIVPGSSSN